MSERFFFILFIVVLVFFSFSDSSEHQGRQEETIRQIEDRADEEANARICHTNHREPCEQSLAGHAGLLFALSLHSILEGIAVGVQDTSGKVCSCLHSVSLFLTNFSTNFRSCFSWALLHATNSLLVSVSE